MGLFGKNKKEKSKVQEKQDSQIKKKLVVRDDSGITKERKKEISLKLSEGGEAELKKLKAKHPLEDEKPKIKIVNLQDSLSKIEDKGVIEVIQNFKNKNLIDKKITGGVFDKKNEILDFLKQEVITYLINKYEDLKDRLSDIRKKGKRVGNLNFQIMSLKLKIKFFDVNFKKGESDKVNQLIINIEEKVKNFELEIKKNEELKNQLEKKKEAEGKLAKQKKEKKPVVKKAAKPQTKPVAKQPVKTANPVAKPVNKSVAQPVKKPVDKSQ